METLTNKEIRKTLQSILDKNYKDLRLAFGSPYLQQDVFIAHINIANSIAIDRRELGCSCINVDSMNNLIKKRLKRALREMKIQIEASEKKLC